MSGLTWFDWLLLVLGIAMLIAMPFIVKATNKRNEMWAAQKKLDDAAFGKLKQDFFKGRL
jgi:hypothetical protein